MKELIDKQVNFFNSNITKDIDFRIEQLKKLKKTIKESEKTLMEAIYKDFKKAEFETYSTELALVYGDINEAIKKVQKWSKVKRVGTNLVNFPAKSYIIPEPLGVSLIIGAWNYPYQLSLAPVVAAMVAGCTIILKPSELPANTSHALAQLVRDNFDPSYFAVVEGGVSETTELLEHKFDKIFFTGSVPVGKTVYEAAAKHLTPVTLELGGKSPAFITEDCKLDICVKRLVWAKFLNAGQTCIAPDYILVHRNIKDKFLKQLKEEIERSDFSFENRNYVQIINDKNMQRLIDLLDKGKITFGGNYELESRYFQPTVMIEVSFDDKVMQEEIFGPILPIIEYENLEEVIHKVKQLPRPLSCYVFTSDKKIKDKILHEISFGGGCVNEAVMHIANSKLPFGGVGNSGIGSYHGEAGFRAFTHYKSVLDKPTWLEMNMKYSPYTSQKISMIKKVLG